MTDGTRTIFNASDGPIPRDRAGHMLAAGESIEVDNLDGLSDHIAESRIVVIEDAVAAIAAEAKARKAADDKADNAKAEADAKTEADTQTKSRARKSAASTQEA